jgi:hypothetical protein
MSRGKHFKNSKYNIGIIRAQIPSVLKGSEFLKGQIHWIMHNRSNMQPIPT